MSKAILEKKLYVAKESPEPIFDLSECGLKNVPSGIYAVIKVYRKESLYLQGNKLSTLKDGGNLKDLSFIKVLDLSRNKFSKLPCDVQYLSHLRILRLDNNELATLPMQIGNLSNLEQLSLSSNKLKKLPDSIGELKKLQYLDLRENPKMNTLPSLHQNKNLKELYLDEKTAWKNPPKNVIIEGLPAILSYFYELNGVNQNECHIVEEESFQEKSDTSESLMQLSLHDKYLQDNLRRLEREKEEKILQKLLMEKNLLHQKEIELILHEQNRNQKGKFLENLVVEQRKIEKDVSRHQKQKEIEQKQFINQLLCVESTADEVIKQMINLNQSRKERHVESLISALIEKPFVKQPFHCQKVLESMENLFAQENFLNQKLEEYEFAKRQVVNKTNSRETEINDKIKNLLSKRIHDKVRLVNAIQDDLDLQRAAVLILIEKTDDRNVELQNQILLIENQLSNLTALELNNKALHLNKYMNDLSEKRLALSELLLDVFAQKQAYRKQLLEQLREAEKKENNKQYWLMQYQRLLECTSKNLPKAWHSLHPNLIYTLALFGVSHCAPFLSTFDTESLTGLSKIDYDSLNDAGIKSKDDQNGILRAIQHFKNQQYSEFHPTAPPISDILDETSEKSNSHSLSITQNDVINSFFSFNPSVSSDIHSALSPSAPELSDINSASLILKHSVLHTECVICMDQMSNMVFLNCGHLCCCAICSENLKLCPLCRCDIERKLQVFNA